MGQVFDSPVDMEGVPAGFANILVKNRLGQLALKSSLEAYLKLMAGPVTSHYIRSSAAFHANELRLPSLLLYSKADPVGDAKRVEYVSSISVCLCMIMLGVFVCVCMDM